MNLCRLVYYSDRNTSEPLDLKRLIGSCQKNNAKDTITGMLHFDGEHFIQVLEGGRAEVSATYHRIAKDPRHTNPVIIAYSDVRERLFPQWGMGLHEHRGEETKQIFMRYFSKPQIDPATVQIESLLDVLQDLAVELE